MDIIGNKDLWFNDEIDLTRSNWNCYIYDKGEEIEVSLEDYMDIWNSDNNEDYEFLCYYFLKFNDAGSCLIYFNGSDIDEVAIDEKSILSYVFYMNFKDINFTIDDLK